MFLKREGKDDSIIAGPVMVESKEKEYNGEKYVEFSVSMGKDKEGNSLPLVNVSVWGRPFEVKKWDRVFACGKLKQTTKEDKTYYSMSADFVAKETVEKKEQVQPELTEIDDDSLPF